MSDVRRESIKRYVDENGDIQFRELEVLFPDVSSMTIRRDLAYLEEKGAIVRTWGGVKAVFRSDPASENLFSLRMTENVHAKKTIAQKALPYVETGRSILIDSGTTTMFLARMLPNQNFSIVTTAPNIAMEIIKNTSPTVTLVGGQLSRNNLTVSGANSINFIKNINIDIAIIAASGYSQKNGFTIGNFDEAELKKAIIKKAGKIIMLMDLSKMDRNMPYTFALLKEVDVLVCDRKPADDVLCLAEKLGVAII